MPFEELARTDPLIVLGIDPGTRAMGFGVVARREGRPVAVDHGSFTAPRSIPLSARLLRLWEGVEAALDHHRPHVLSLEEAFFLRNAQSALRLGESRGLILLAAERRGVPVVQYPTAVVKKSVCGHGGAPKVLVQDMVARELHLPGPPGSHDAADALALALCLLFDPRLDPRFPAASPEPPPRTRGLRP